MTVDLKAAAGIGRSSSALAAQSATCVIENFKR
jgi:hypothetical protein